MPFSRSRSIESSTRSLTSCPARKAPDCQSMASTSVVLPWSTWATMATLRMSLRGMSADTGSDRLAGACGLPGHACPEAGQSRGHVLGAGEDFLERGGEAPDLILLDHQGREGLDDVHAVPGDLAADAVLVKKRHGDHLRKK